MEIEGKKGENFLGILLLGLFLILWSVNGYFIGGNPFKYMLLFSGLSLVFYINVKNTFLKTRKWFNFFVFVFTIGLGYYLKAIIQDQNVTSFVITTFGAINLLLLTTGFLIGQNWSKFRYLNNRQIYIIAFLTIIGVGFFFAFQNTLYSNNAEVARKVTGDEEGAVNVIGIAYTNALIFIIIFNIVRFLPKNRKFLYYLLILCMLLSIFVIMQTQSRGALIYLLFIIIISLIHSLGTKKFIVYFKRSLIYILLFFVAAIILVKTSPSAEVAFEGLFIRLENLFNFLEGTHIDNSALERENIYGKFFNEYPNYLFLGMDKYEPYPHNIFIEIIQRFGLIFGAPVLCILIVSVVVSVKQLIRRDRILILDIFSMIFLFSFFQSLSSMSLEMNRSLWLSMGVVLGSLGKLKTFIRETSV